MNEIRSDLFDIICCPSCGGDLRLKETTLVCILCNKEYIIKDGIPILLE